MSGKPGTAAESTPIVTDGSPEEKPAPDIAGIVRDATPDDLPRVVEIYGHYVTSSFCTFEEVPPDLAEITARYNKIKGLGLPWLVVEDEGGVQGYAYASQFRDRSAYRYVVEDSIYVAHDLVRKGYGSLLMGELIARCEALGKRQMIAVVGGSATVGSIGLHGRMGFRVAGVLPSFGFKFGDWADTVLMTRSLGEGDMSKPES